jgi:magnesium chelatase subunit I
VSTKTSTEKIKTLGQLRASGYTSKSVKQEMHDNLIAALKEKKRLFEDIQGYEDSVIPQLESAILSRHNILLLGLRGQAKTKLTRLMVQLLDEYIPVVAGSELNDDPLQPLSAYAKDLLAKMGDDTPITWMHRNERYIEKLATPDVSVADLIGDLDPVKAASMRLHFADERVIHFGLIPRSHRCIFVINELPDLQARIQVALFNILQEGDIQVRGFRMRFPIDLQFVFTANPEDYTSRGSIVTPLKDRIGSQILTHYPKNIETSSVITRQEAKITPVQREQISIPDIVHRIIEQVAFEARKSEYIDQKSGVSARMTITAYECLHSVIQRRMLINGETKGSARIGDVFSIIPAITGKVELVYEGELEGIANVAFMLIGKAIRSEYHLYFPSPERSKKSKQKNPYAGLLQWFAEGNELNLEGHATQKDYEVKLKALPGLESLIKDFQPGINPERELLMREFILHGLAEYSQISRKKLDKGLHFGDMMGSIFKMDEPAEDNE